MQSKQNHNHNHHHVVALWALVLISCLIESIECSNPFDGDQHGGASSVLDHDDNESIDHSSSRFSNAFDSYSGSSGGSSSSNNGGLLVSNHQHQQQQPAQQQATSAIDNYYNNIDFYAYRNIFASAVSNALEDCRNKFKWDRWNCPKKAFLSILDRDESNEHRGDLLPANKELGFTRALIASSTVLATIKSCSSGTNRMCDCGSPQQAVVVAPTATTTTTTTTTTTLISPQNNHLFEEQQLTSGGGAASASASASTAAAAPPSLERSINYYHRAQPYLMSHNRSKRHAIMLHEQPPPPATTTSGDSLVLVAADEQQQRQQQQHHHQMVIATTTTGGGANGNKFVWTGCEQTLRFGFKMARMYLDKQDENELHDEASRLINEHNYRAGRLAVRRIMRRKCKCHGVSGTCQLRTCWRLVPSMSELGDHLRRQYQLAAKVGASSTRDSDPASLAKELASIDPEKLVFADASPDYCYDNKRLGLNGTLERYCSRAQSRDGLDTSRAERSSCDRLCTKCGYKIEKVQVRVERQCECRFVYCCSVKCKRCPDVEEAYKCVRHS